MTTAPPFFISLHPVDSSFAVQTIAIAHSDSIQLLLGGTRPSYFNSSEVPHHTADFIFNDCNIDPNVASISHVDGIISLNHHSDGKNVQLNDVLLLAKETMALSHGDHIDLGYSSEYTNGFRSRLRLRVAITASLPSTFRASSCSPVSPTSFMSATPAALCACFQLLTANEVLQEQLDEAQHRLQHTLDALQSAPVGHSRPYSYLLADLRVAYNEFARSHPEQETDSVHPPDTPEDCWAVDAPVAQLTLTPNDSELEHQLIGRPFADNDASDVLDTCVHDGDPSCDAAVQGCPTPSHQSSAQPNGSEDATVDIVAKDSPGVLIRPSSPESSTSTSVLTSVLADLTVPPIAAAQSPFIESTSVPTSVLTSVLAESTVPALEHDALTTSIDASERSRRRRYRRADRAQRAWLRARRKEATVRLANATVAVERVGTAWIRARTQLLKDTAYVSTLNASESFRTSNARSSTAADTSSSSLLCSAVTSAAPELPFSPTADVIHPCETHSGTTTSSRQVPLPDGSLSQPPSIPPCMPPFCAPAIPHPIGWSIIQTIQQVSKFLATALPYCSLEYSGPYQPNLHPFLLPNVSSATPGLLTS
ncbi:hypothetical protein CF319_g8786 [Tilletia indica]|nr:hypothetical protein CF319_g8786 [Tilletia indica]